MSAILGNVRHLGHLWEKRLTGRLDPRATVWTCAYCLQQVDRMVDAIKEGKCPEGATRGRKAPLVSRQKQ